MVMVPSSVQAGARYFVPFELPGPSVEDFIRRALQRISIRLVARLFRGQVLAVTEP